MIKLFELQGGRVIPTEHCYSLKFLKKIIDEYPDDYMTVFQYIFYKTCPNADLNPFFHTPYEEKDELITDELDINFSLEDDTIIEAIKKCEKLYSTEASRAYEGIAQALDNIAEFMKTTRITGGKDGNITQIIGAAKNFSAMRESFKAAYEDLKKEQTTKVSGQKRLAYDTDDD